MKDISTAIANKVKANPSWTVFAQIQRSVLKILADGRPARMEETAKALGLPTDDARALVAQLPMVELDNQSRIIGLGLTFIPTPHRIQFDDRDHLLYTWCIPDALIFPRMLGLSAQVVSRCQATKQPVRFTVGPNGVDDIQPATAVVSWWPSGLRSEDIRGTGCKKQVVFVSPEAAASWLQEHLGSVVMPVAEAYEAAIRLGEQTGLLPYDS